MPKLRTILDDVERQLEEQLRTPRDERDPALGLLRIVRSAIAIAQGIERLGEPEEEASLVLFRALYEKLLDANQIAAAEDWKRQVLKMRVSAFIELATFGRRTDPVRPEAESAEEEVEHLRGMNRAAVEEVECQRRRWKYHWSGKSRVLLEQELPPAIQYYAPLSWIAHGSLGPVLEYQPAITADLRDVAGMMLLLIWNLCARLADFPLLAVESYGFGSDANQESGGLNL